MAVLTMLRGSDLVFRMFWPGVGTAPFPLAGWSVSGFEVHSKLRPNLSLAVVDAPGGEILVRIEWDDSYVNGSTMSFRVQLSKSGDEISSPKMRVNVI